MAACNNAAAANRYDLHGDGSRAGENSRRLRTGVAAYFTSSHGNQIMAGLRGRNTKDSAAEDLPARLRQSARIEDSNPFDQACNRSFTASMYFYLAPLGRTRFTHS